MVSPMLSMNQATIKHADLRQTLDTLTQTGYHSVGLWREPVEAIGVPEAVRMVSDSGLCVSSMCRGGFFTMPEGPERRAAIDDNRRLIEETSAFGCTVLVLVVGGLPQGSKDLAEARSRVAEALAELEADALAAGVTLAIEPLHPMYCTDRACVSTLDEALDIAAPFNPKAVGVVVDTFHVFWDPNVLRSIARAGREGRIAAYQVCDYRTPLEADPLLSRHYPGEGVIDFKALTQAVAATGWHGDIECEIFNRAVWDTPFDEVSRHVADAFDKYVAPYWPAE
ncbi:sugar phosphate isomerase/epimerase family protein [Bifidobacterium sp. ESL0745]|uniref:sugar phosphate isomerase/epimerase family protein n=1 Tax=Bifidobacterium sp. ESL0745 TaxID=2983226 RepID=UPI0023F7276E|nr:sugar phosphate isomerase/epimerase family protein [Bifidobacterium sp. ESL0745]MDF7664671.1 sugar phosphate isomerase/epimerase [Bifidobacterium sp. ESL0745]